MVVGDTLTAGTVEAGVVVVPVVAPVVVRAVVVSAVVVRTVVVKGTLVVVSGAVVVGTVGTVPVGIVVVVVTSVDEGADTDVPVVVSRSDPWATTEAASAPRAPSATSAITGRARRSTMGHGSNGPYRNPLAIPLESWWIPLSR